MKIHLLRDHTALLEDDKQDTISIEPACTGRLMIEGKAFAVRPGSPVPRMPEIIGYVKVLFTPAGGVLHVGVNPHMENGVPVSHVDYTTEYLPMRLRQDALERQVEALTKLVHELKSDQKHNAMGFLTHNTRKTEV